MDMYLYFFIYLVALHLPSVILYCDFSCIVVDFDDISLFFTGEGNLKALASALLAVSIGDSKLKLDWNCIEGPPWASKNCLTNSSSAIVLRGFSM